MIEGGGFGPHKFSRVEGGPSCFTEPRVSCRGSVGLDSFRQHDRGIFHQLSGRNSFLVPVSASLGPVGMVPYCLQRKIFLQAAHIPGEDNIVADFLSRGKYLPSEWVLKRSVFARFALCRLLRRR